MDALDLEKNFTPQTLAHVRTCLVPNSVGFALILAHGYGEGHCSPRHAGWPTQRDAQLRPQIPEDSPAPGAALGTRIAVTANDDVRPV